MNELLPKGYVVEKTELFGDALAHKGEDGQVTEWFRLTNREFEAIDHYLGYLPSQLIKYLIKREKRQLWVADIGGGMQSLCADDIAAKYGSAVRVVNVDLLHDSSTPPQNAYRVKGDICRLPITGIDLALCYQVLPFLENDGKYTKGFQAVREIAGALRPGGVALVDEDYICNLYALDPRRISLTTQSRAMFSARLGNRSEPGQVIFGGPTTFLMVEKNPIDFNLWTVRERIIGHI